MTEKRANKNDNEKNEENHRNNEIKRDSRENRTEEKKEYDRIVDKHRKRAEREKRNGKEHLMDNLKTKKKMQTFRKNMPDKYTPRTKQNCTEDDDWRNFYEENEVNKVMLEDLKPEVLNKIEKEKEMKEIEHQLKVKEVLGKVFVKEDENYYEDYEYEDHERDGVLVCDPVTSEELKAEAELMRKHMKNMRKQELKKPPPSLPKSDKSQYEKIREDNIRERVKGMIASGLWSEDELTKIRYGIPNLEAVTERKKNGIESEEDKN